MSAIHELPSAHDAPSVRVSVLPMRMGPRGLEALLVAGDDGLEIYESSPHGHEDLGLAARRIAHEHLGLSGHFDQLGAFGSVFDGICVTYVMLVRPAAMPGISILPGGRSLRWRDVRHPGTLRMVIDTVRAATRRLKADLEDSDAGFHLVEEAFTVSELRTVHESVQGVPIDPSNFRKRVLRWVEDGKLRETSSRKATATRPALVYRCMV